MARSPDEEGEGRKHKSSRDKDRKKEHKKKKDKKRKVRVYLCLCVPIDTWVEARMHPGLLSQGCKRPAPCRAGTGGHILSARTHAHTKRDDDGGDTDREKEKEERRLVKKAKAFLKEQVGVGGIWCVPFTCVASAIKPPDNTGTPCAYPALYRFALDRFCFMCAPGNRTGGGGVAPHHRLSALPSLQTPHAQQEKEAAAAKKKDSKKKDKKKSSKKKGKRAAASEDEGDAAPPRQAQVPIVLRAEDDYYKRQMEFRVWLKLAKRVAFEVCVWGGIYAGWDEDGVDWIEVDRSSSWLILGITQQFRNDNPLRLNDPLDTPHQSIHHAISRWAARRRRRCSRSFAGGGTRGSWRTCTMVCLCCFITCLCVIAVFLVRVCFCVWVRGTIAL